MLALVSFTSTVYPSLIGTWPPSLFFLSKHMHTHIYAHTFRYTHTVRTCTHTFSGIMGTSGGAHPMHRQTFPVEHQKNHQRGFKQPATANTNTHIYTHLLTVEVKARPDERRENEHLIALDGIASPKVNSRSIRAAFCLHQCLIYTSSLMSFPASVQDSPGHRERQRP